ncbi:MAG: hypothetical protein E7218_01465 [Anaerofustis stercorihominis]|nr:hypothetical protein [Anaerofustis stercorihominis]
MNIKYSDEVLYLASRSTLSKKRCHSVLEECGGDVNEALDRLMIIAGNKYDKAMDNISALITGERGSIVTVTEGGEAIFRVPCAIVLLCLFVLDIPGWVLAILIMLFIVFGAEINIVFTENDRSSNIKTVSVEEYKKKQSISKKISKKKNTGGRSGDGYNEIIIE